MLILKKLLIVIRLALPVGVNASSIDYTLSYVSGEQLEGHFTGGPRCRPTGHCIKRGQYEAATATVAPEEMCRNARTSRVSYQRPARYRDLPRVFP